MEKCSDRRLGLIGLPVHQQQCFLPCFIVGGEPQSTVPNNWTRNILKNKSVKMDSLALQRGKFVKFCRVTLHDITSLTNSILLTLKRQRNK